MSTSESTSLDSISEYIQKIRARGDKFRVLVIGRANAGKTTILQRTCNTAEGPVIYDRAGKKIDPSVIQSSAFRGFHDIENEMVFKSNPTFRFHDSRGFESGGVEELERVKAFIEYRCKEKSLEKQLHVIWYCIPVDDSRLFTAAEQQFFAECGNGPVPIIVIFTKFDALDNKAFKALRTENISRSEALRLAPKRALDDFETTYRESLSEKMRLAKARVFLRDMHKETANVSLLMEKTADALDNETLQRIFVSTQRNNLELCMRYALEKVILPEVEKYREWEPRFFKKEADHVFRSTMTLIFAWFPHFGWTTIAGVNRDEIEKRRFDQIKDRRYYEDKDDLDLTAVLNRFTFLDWTSSPVCQIAHLGITTVILTDFSFLLWNKDQKNVFFTSLDLYENHSKQDALAEAIEEASNAYQSSEDFLQKMIQIAMDNRLSPEILKTLNVPNS